MFPSTEHTTILTFSDFRTNDNYKYSMTLLADVIGILSSSDVEMLIAVVDAWKNCVITEESRSLKVLYDVTAALFANYNRDGQNPFVSHFMEEYWPDKRSLIKIAEMTKTKNKELEKDILCGMHKCTPEQVPIIVAECVRFLLSCITWIELRKVFRKYSQNSEL